MNDPIPNVLARFVDELLAPIGAGRRDRMREEILAHLLAVFDDERARHNDDEAAAAATLRRFGNPADVGDELRSSVPWRERFWAHLFGRKETLMKWLLVCLGVIGVLVGMGFIMPAFSQLLREAGLIDEPGLHHYSHGYVIALAVALLTLGCVLALAGVWSVVRGIKQFRATTT